jgi:hypothetical protein
MVRTGCKVLMACLATVAMGAAPPKRQPPPPPLLPGEALTLVGPDQEVYRYGDTATEGPMGGLSHLVWVQLEGDAWASADLQYKCSGKMGPFQCSAPKGHGRVDLQKALMTSCNLAFLTWAHLSADRWQLDYGDGPARARLVEAFQPFLGDRLPEGNDVPDLTLAWVGEGDLLRTSPEALLRWLMDPGQEFAVRLYRRCLLSVYDESFKKNAWWIDAETTPAAGAPGKFQGWAVGGNELVLAVLRLPPGTTRQDAQNRFLTVLMGARKK